MVLIQVSLMYSSQKAHILHVFMPRVKNLLLLFNPRSQKGRKTSLESDDVRNVLNAKDYIIYISIPPFLCIDHPIMFILPL